jgi:hypothetical protein
MHTTCVPPHYYPEKKYLDISNTYWALEALSVASRRGLRIPPGVWDGAVKSLTTWGTYFRNVHVPRYRLIWGNDSFPKEAREFFLDRDRRDTVLRITRRLRVEGYEGGALAFEEKATRLEEASFWPYTNYIMKYSLAQTANNHGELFYATNGYAAQVSGVGALVLSLEGLGQKALRSRVVEQGLLYARVHFRHVFATMDVRPCTESADPFWRPDHRLPPRDLGYSFLLLERVLDGLGIERLGSHEWFPLLALHSLDLQKEDGGWYAWRGDRLIPTALHLLALSRGRSPDFSEELPVYQRGPIITGQGRSAQGIGSALVESKEGKFHRVVEVLASLERIGRADRIALAEKAIEGLTPDQRIELLPLLRRLAEDGPVPSKSFAGRAIAGIEKGGSQKGRE